MSVIDHAWGRRRLSYWALPGRRHVDVWDMYLHVGGSMVGILVSMCWELTESRFSAFPNDVHVGSVDTRQLMQKSRLDARSSPAVPVDVRG
jgi:hypothetical protein